MVLALLVIVFTLGAFYHLGQSPLIDFDEAIYAQVSCEALQNHTPLGFTWVGNIILHPTEMWFEKPPLMIWLTEMSYIVFGINEFATRFWPAVFAVLTLPLTFFFVKGLTKSSAAAILSVAAFFIAFQFDDYAGVLQMDIPVGYFVLLAMLSFWRARENDRFYFLFWAALGFGLMVKSVIGLLPLPVILVYSALAWDFRFLKSRNLWIGTLLFFVIVLPWHIIEHFRYGKDFWGQYLFYHLLQRYSGTLEGNGGSPYFFVGILLKQQVLFWCLAGSLIYFTIRAIHSKSHLFVLTAFLFVFLFFSKAGTKLPAYLLVIYPFAVAMIGMTLGEFAQCLEKLKKHSGECFAAVAILIFITAGIENFHAQLAVKNSPQLASDRAVGEYLRNNVPGQRIYYYCAQGQTKPSIMFYSGRTVFGYDFHQLPRPEDKFIAISSVPLHFTNQATLFSAATETVYQIQ